MKKIDEILHLVGSMQRFSAPDDRLTNIIAEISGDELSYEELDMVFAAADSKANYRNFEALLKSKR